MSDIQSHMFQVGGLTLHRLEVGEGDPVLFLHGWPTHAQLWRHALPRVGVGRRAIAVDLPGYGLSDKPLDVSYSFRFYDQLLTDLLDALGIERCGLVVHDIGGPLGLHWAVQHPERVSDLAILNTLMFPELHWTVTAFVLAAKLPGLRHYLGSPRGIAATMKFGVLDKARLTPELLDLYRTPFLARPARRALLKAAGALNPKGFATIAEGLPGMTMPVRVIYGEKDRILPDVARTMARLAEILPHAEVTALPGVGHFLQEDAPDAVADLLGAFFNER